MERGSCLDYLRYAILELIISPAKAKLDDQSLGYSIHEPSFIGLSLVEQGPRFRLAKVP